MSEKFYDKLQQQGSARNKAMLQHARLPRGRNKGKKDPTANVNISYGMLPATHPAASHKGVIEQTSQNNDVNLSEYVAGHAPILPRHTLQDHQMHPTTQPLHGKSLCINHCRPFN